MIRFDGMSAQESKGVVTQLPAGPYVCKVLDARVEGKAPDQQLAVIIEVLEGEYAGFYMKKYQAQKEKRSNYEIKYKGVLRLRIPNPANKKAMYPESDKKRFSDMLWRFEKSNPGLHFDLENGLDESQLKGLVIGISVQEDTYNGASFTKPVRFEIADDVREGKVKVMEPKQRDDVDPTPAPMVDQRSQMQIVNTEPLPWDENDKPY